MSSDYFVEEGQLVGECDQLISQAETSWRDVSVFEMHPYRRVARFSRNIQFTSESTRTPLALEQALSYLHSTLFPLLAQPHAPQLCLFLAETLKAVRCELFVQGITWPQVQLLIFRLQTILEVVSGQTSTMETSAVCLESLISGKNRETMEKKYSSEYREALKYSILLAKKMDLQRLLTTHEIIMDDPLLASTLRFRVRCNYTSYFSALREEDYVVKCILWRSLHQEMNQAAAVIAKAYRQVSRQLAMEIGVDVQDEFVEAKNFPALASASKGRILSSSFDIAQMVS